LLNPLAESFYQLGGSVNSDIGLDEQGFQVVPQLVGNLGSPKQPGNLSKK
jgi:hypothetical protein